MLFCYNGYDMIKLFLVDNNTWNNSHIALVGKAMSSNESAAYHIMTELDVDYVLGRVIFYVYGPVVKL